VTFTQNSRRRAGFLIPGYGAPLTRPPRNPRHAYDADGREIRPMDLGNMREHGVCSVAAHCPEVSCGHSGSVNVDGLPDDSPLKCDAQSTPEPATA